MSFDIDIGFTSDTGKKPTNEDFAAAMLPERGQEGMGAIVAIADGVSTGGMGREAAQTTVTSLVRDYFGTPETWAAAFDYGFEKLVFNLKFFKREIIHVDNKPIVPVFYLSNDI